jgi:hypothetical protein
MGGMRIGCPALAMRSPAGRRSVLTVAAEPVMRKFVHHASLLVAGAIIGALAAAWVVRSYGTATNGQAIKRIHLAYSFRYSTDPASQKQLEEPPTEHAHSAESRFYNRLRRKPGCGLLNTSKDNADFVVEIAASAGPGDVRSEAWLKVVARNGDVIEFDRLIQRREFGLDEDITDKSIDRAIDVLCGKQD